MSTSAGTKVTSDPQTLNNPKNGNPGIVTSDSLAGESIQGGGSFGANADVRGTINTPAGSTTISTTDTSAARELPPAQSAAVRDAGTGSDVRLNEGSGVGPTYNTGSGSAASATANNYSNDPVFGSAPGGGQVAAGTAPGYVNHPAPSMGDTFQPKGQGLKEGRFDSEAAPNASFTTDIGGKGDPGRVALGSMEARNVPVAGKAGKRQQEVRPKEGAILMAELTTSTKLDPDQHLLLDQPLLRLPHELLRKNLKSAQRQIEITNKSLTTTVSSIKPNDALASIDATLQKAQNLKRKLEALHEEEKVLHRQQKARIEHLKELHEIPGLADVKYDTWAHTRLDRLLVDYLLRSGYTESARELAREKGIEDLVDVAVFEEVGRVEASLRRGEVKEALQWCTENKQALKKISSNLELELRLQQFIELARTGEMVKLVEGILHARKYLATPGKNPGSEEEAAGFGLKAGGLLAHPPETTMEPYRTLYSPSRYETLARLFIRTHHDLFALPTQALLHIALSAGLSALKTPTCHSIHNLQQSPATTTASNALTMLGAPLCPICSSELNELARSVPYAHHTKSLMEGDPVVLPNGRVMGRERLRVLNEKMGVRRGRVRDPGEGMEGEEWDEGVLRKVFIS
ncbi:hypothetical protein EJ03DRAFT_385305 [Teratosphaeria nubilosa]|uniref:Protein FYV10 n=1 Tax=Teratosphaeria nubilosa TaxID=161662 RepID=A0A6G1KYA3_9PEZI|nr:hypothetical protein EJ03DRAFT_385305 [Teratosphaeria nubilosa]